jgi:hypothetical protein
MTIQELKRRWSKIDVKRAAISIVSERKEDIIDKNREQLMDGFDKEKKRLKKYASPAYAAKKNKRNPSPGYGNPDLYDKGGFQNSMKLNIQSTNMYEITSTDSKTPDLKKKYGATIFGLTTDNKEDVKYEIINPGLVTYIKKETGL